MMAENPAVTSHGFRVKLYSEQQDFVWDTDEILNVEDICKDIAKHLGITTRTFSLFGLVDESHRIWFGLHQEICPLQWDKGVVYFRIRFCVPSRKLQSFVRKESKFIEYFYYQCRHDFLTENLSKLYGKRINKEKCFGLGVLERLIYARSNQIDPANISSFKDSIPQAVLNEVTSHLNPFKNMKFQNSCKGRLKDLNSEVGGASVESLWIRFINGIHQYINNYLIETYDVEVKHPQGQVDRRLISVKPNQEIECVGKLKDIRSVEIKKTQDPSDDHPWIVLVFADGVPKMLLFKEENMAESFVSLLIGYYRLTVSFYFCLMERREMPSLKKLHKLKFCHGPIYSLHCRKKVKENGEDACILRQSTSFDQLDLIYVRDGTIASLSIDCLPDGRLCFSGGTPRDSVLSLMESDERTKHLKQPIRHTFDENHGILLCHEDDGEDDLSRSTEAIVPKTNQDVRFLSENEVTITSTILGRGFYTEVCDANMASTDQTGRVSVAVKRLRSENRDKCLEPFLMTAHKMRQMKSPYIVQLLGVCLLPPVYMVLEHSHLGNLERYLRDYPTIVSPPALLQSMLSIMNALQHLAPIHENWFVVHGSVRCRNILVFHDDHYFEVKLGDPGMTHLYNQLPLDHTCNKERQPWLAPELLTDLKSITPQSDLYAFGTTVMEMWSKGALPPNVDVQTHIPDSLGVEDNDSGWLKDLKSAVIDVMKSCHKTDPSKRKQLPQLLRDILPLQVGADNSRTYNRAMFDTEISNSLSNGLPVNGQPAAGDASADAPPLPLPRPDKGSPDCPSSIADTPSLGNLTFKDGQWDVRSAEGDATARSGENLITSRHLTNGNASSHHSGRLLPRQRSSKLHPNTDWMIAKDRVNKKQIVGSGYFGVVYEGSLKKADGNTWVPCAVKTLKVQNPSQTDYDNILAEEVNIMCKLNHENVVKCYGFCLDTVPEPYWLVMEYLEKGSLYTILKNSRQDTDFNKALTVEVLFTICNDVALGMRYLALQGIIHRDLAARNILLTENYHAKITDFGLARMLDESDYYRAQRENVLPAHYYAPESLAEKKFTEKGDVWSYGILLWEIYTKGEKPALIREGSGIDLWDALYRELCNGKRLPCPPHCPDLAWELMVLNCWMYNPNDRPNFEQILVYLHDHRNWLSDNQPIQV